MTTRRSPMQFKQRRQLKRTKIEIIPMIDTMFFLLVFFMLSSLALTRLMGLPVNLPQASTAPKTNTLDLTITIDKGENVYVNKDRVDIKDVAASLVQHAGTTAADLGQTPVIINADLMAHHGTVVRVMDEARTVGVTKFAIATKPE